MFARQNKSEEVKPWAIISIVAPMKLHGVCIILAFMSIAIWRTYV